MSVKYVALRRELAARCLLFKDEADSLLLCGMGMLVIRDEAVVSHIQLRRDLLRDTRLCLERRFDGCIGLRRSSQAVCGRDETGGLMIRHEIRSGMADVL